MKEEHGTIFASRLKEKRESKGLTQTELASILGYKNYTTISKWESGDSLPRGRELKILAEFFNISSDYLLGIEKEIKSSSIETIYNKLEPPRQKVVLDTAEQQLEEQHEKQNNVVNLKDDLYEGSIVKNGVDTMAARFADPTKGLPEGVTIEELKAFLEAEAKRQGFENRPD
ncbi:helix-turn-helix transcriptional regulator [Enterococcus sp. BWB1-3]|uniref:helix-turn-helix domain-containing protein n=1 Tax=Enterococcus sp. BWB1-3 TaxID=2787713 RepID=UPI0019240A9C|nr:helix-turn-helix transcriptional regulator [Enterococcus sp. BWB1-3]MBL1228727.1 helix-turn-helix transcriptional regulator [Enterococcus sp. BWB1-3]